MRKGQITPIPGGTRVHHLTYVGIGEIRPHPRRKSFIYYVTLLCDCGRTTQMRKQDFLSRRNISCGCHRLATLRAHAATAAATHGQSNSRAWAAWKAMKMRCKPGRFHPQAKDYWMRGILVCERWQTFENFYSDMGDCPPGLTLERIDNDAGYAPGNCRWATRKEQAANRRPKSIRIAA